MQSFTSPLFYKLSLLFVVLFTFNTATFAANKTVKFTKQEIQQLTGHYSTAYGYFHLQANNGVVTTIAEGKRIYLRKKDDGLIYPTYKLFGFIPLAEDDMAFSMKWARGRQLVILHTKEKGEKITPEIGEKFTPVPISAAWKQRVGRYKVISKKKSESYVMKLQIKNNVLIGSGSDDNTPYPLLPRSDLSAIIPGSEEGHLVELFMKNKQLFFRQGKNISQLVKQ